MLNGSAAKGARAAGAGALQSVWCWKESGARGAQHGWCSVASRAPARGKGGPQGSRVTVTRRAAAAAVPPPAVPHTAGGTSLHLQLPEPLLRVFVRGGGACPCCIPKGRGTAQQTLRLSCRVESCRWYCRREVHTSSSRRTHHHAADVVTVRGSIDCCRAELAVVLLRAADRLPPSPRPARRTFIAGFIIPAFIIGIAGIIPPAEYEGGRPPSPQPANSVAQCWPHGGTVVAECWEGVGKGNLPAASALLAKCSQDAGKLSARCWGYVGNMCGCQHVGGRFSGHAQRRRLPRSAEGRRS
eukprot:gene12579-biopygen5203